MKTDLEGCLGLDVFVNRRSFAAPKQALQLLCILNCLDGAMCKNLTSDLFE